MEAKSISGATVTTPIGHTDDKTAYRCSRNLLPLTPNSWRSTNIVLFLFLRRYMYMSMHSTQKTA